ncbi:hypothetical protein ACEOWG_000456 [Bacillus cereus]
MDDFLTSISAFGTIVSAFFVFLTYKVYKKSLDTRLYVISEISDEKEEDYDFRYDLERKEAFKDLDFEGEGFPHRDFHHNPQKWNLRIKNNSDSPATNIKLKYRITIYQNIISYGIDVADILDSNLDTYVFHDQEVTIEYLPPGDEYLVPLIYLKGKFPKAIVQVLYFKCNENKFINELTTVGVYEHPSKYLLADMPDVRRFLGTSYMKKSN